MSEKAMNVTEETNVVNNVEEKHSSTSGLFTTVVIIVMLTAWIYCVFGLPTNDLGLLTVRLLCSAWFAVLFIVPIAFFIKVIFSDEK